MYTHHCTKNFHFVHLHKAWSISIPNMYALHGKEKTSRLLIKLSLARGLSHAISSESREKYSNIIKN